MIDLSEYERFSDAMKSLGSFLDDVYHRNRTPSTPGCFTPAELRTAMDQHVKILANLIHLSTKPVAWFCGRTSKFGVILKHLCCNRPAPPL